VVVLTFDQQGVLRSIDTRSQDDSVDVAVVSRSTPAPGNSASFLQQLLGNVGKFSPTGTGNSVGSGAPGASGSKF
jgi:outer membrane protein assembly factor BamE (lipoprotein component of BamABCDE complex)